MINIKCVNDVLECDRNTALFVSGPQKQTEIVCFDSKICLPTFKCQIECTPGQIIQMACSQNSFQDHPFYTIKTRMFDGGFWQPDPGKCVFQSRSFEGFCGGTSSFSLGVVLGIAGGGLALLIIIIVSICCYRKKKNNGYKKMTS